MAELQIIEAVKEGDIARVKELISSGADINQQDEQGWTPLNFAVGKGDLAIVKLLLEKGADVFQTGRDHRTPYMIALAASHLETARLLREVEDHASDGKLARPERSYCKAYYLKQLRTFPGWQKEEDNWRAGMAEAREDNADTLTSESIVFIHQDYTVTQSMWPGEDAIFTNVTPEWRAFCASELKFSVPGDLDLIMPAS
jgi:hypothetical protein